MTIQTVFINRGNLVLASDLRATIDENKSYVGVKKIFELEKEIPAGIMINGLLDFEKIPLETLIGEFKNQIEDFESVREIRDEFLKFLSENTNHTPIEEYLKEDLCSFKTRLRESIEEMGFENALNYKTSNIIPKFLKEYSNFNDEFHDLIPENHNKEDYNLRIWELFSYELNFEGTGVIIAGFDKANHYASLFSFNIFCNDNGEILWNETESLENIEDPIIRVYAINEEAYAFITGINEDFETTINLYINDSNENIFNDFKYWLIEHNVENANEIADICKQIIEKEYSDFNEVIFNNKSDIINDTAKLSEYLPKRLLCDFADYLIKLTALKQQISLNLETVSSESDVLLITKIDNPKWVKYTDEII